MGVQPFSAVLLAAGRPAPGGRDKAVLEIDGVRLWRRQRDALRSLAPGELFLSARPDQAWLSDIRGFDAVLFDAVPNAGPLCGITAAIERASHGQVVVLAVDLPAVDPGWFRGLLDACDDGVGAVGRRGGRFEPLAAVYPRAMMPLAWEALAAGRYGLDAFVAAAVAEGLLRVREITGQQARWFEPWSEPVRG